MVRAADLGFENLAVAIWSSTLGCKRVTLRFGIHSWLVFRRVCRICQIRGSLGCESDMV